MRYFDQIIAHFDRSRRPHEKPKAPRLRLRLETLEPRQMLSGSPLANLTAAKLTAVPAAPLAAAASSIQNMTQLAQQMISSGQLKAPTGPSYLFLNFDGWAACPYNGKIDVTAFNGTAGDVDSILYRTAEEFAPFNVIVARMYGNGAFSTTTGATTIFVGNGLSGDFTPSAFMDYPNQHGSTSHVVNSDAYDVAFVSQVFTGLSTSVDRDASIANDVAHEAGHTFGLAHVRTDGQADYPNNSTNATAYDPHNSPDVMSYDSNNDFFSNISYNVTQANGSGVDPKFFPDYQGTNITMQNSFTYLQTVLGARPTTSQIGVTDESLGVKNAGPQTVNFVDPGNYSATAGDHAAAISVASSVSGTLQRDGDYTAYQLSLINSANWVSGQQLAITPGANYSSTFMVFDTTSGTTSAGSLVASSDFTKPLFFTPNPTHTYMLVVGGAAGAFTLTAAPLQLNLQGLNFTFINASNVVTGHMIVNSQIGDAIQASFTPAGSTTAMSVSGFLGGAINGLSSISVYAETSVTTTSGPPQEMVTLQTTTVTSFTGQAKWTANGPSVLSSVYTLSGQGVYRVTRTSTITNNGKGTRTTTTLANLAMVTGTANYVLTKQAAAAIVASGSGGQSGGVPVAGAIPTKTEAIDLVMADYGDGDSPSGDSNKRQPSKLLLMT